MPTPPDTTSYLWLGLAAAAVIMALFVVSMIVRWQNLKKDERLIEELDES